MQYALLVYESEQDQRARADGRDAVLQRAYRDYTEALRAAGVLRGGEGLGLADLATVVGRHAGETQVQDGPYADTKEQLGGFFVIEVPDLDTAITWAARCPGADTGKVEVRPTFSPAR